METIEKVNQMITDGVITRDQASKYFPELAESEEEKIRKALIKLVKKAGEGYENVTEGVSIQKAISWLEKQGEKAKYHDICDKCVRQPTCQSDCFLQQDVQKPIEWSEEDEKMYKAISIALTLKSAEGYLKTWYTTPEEADNWLKSLKDRVQPQPKQEWSEEDEEMKREIIEFLKSRAGFKQEWIDWLNKQSEKKESYIDMSLVDAVRFCVADNLAHKSTDDNGNTISFGVYIDNTIAKKLTNELFDIFQKSVEWSEEEKKKIDNILNVLIDYKELEPEYFWLKSIRPQLHWKPSHDKMWALSTLVNIPESASDTCRKTVQELLEELKKLREE